MDSPLLPTIRGGPRDLDESFADMSLASADTPLPASHTLRSVPPTSSSSGSGKVPDSGSVPSPQRLGGPPHGQPRASIFGRPPTARTAVDETPESLRAMSGFQSNTTQSTGSGTMGGKPKPRQSIFPPLGSSLKGNNGNPNDRQESIASTGAGSSRPRSTYENDEGGEGDVTVLPSGSTTEEDGDDTGTMNGTRGQATQEGDGMTPEARMKRDERLKDSLYELRGMNDTFEIFLQALESARGHNEVSPSTSPLLPSSSFVVISALPSRHGL